MEMNMSDLGLKFGRCLRCKLTDECYNKAIDDVFDFLKNKRDKKYMKLNLDDLEIKKYKEQLKRQ